MAGFWGAATPDKILIFMGILVLVPIECYPDLAFEREEPRHLVYLGREKLF